MDSNTAATQVVLTVLRAHCRLACFALVQKAVQVVQGGQSAPRRKKARARPAAVRTLTELIEIAAPSEASMDETAAAAQLSAAADRALSIEDSMPAFFSSPDDSMGEVGRTASCVILIGPQLCRHCFALQVSRRTSTVQMLHKCNRKWLRPTRLQARLLFQNTRGRALAVCTWLSRPHYRSCAIKQGHGRQASAASRRQHTGGQPAQTGGQQGRAGVRNLSAAGRERGIAGQPALGLARRDADADVAGTRGARVPQPDAAVQSLQTQQAEASPGGRGPSADKEAAQAPSSAGSPQQALAAEPNRSSERQQGRGRTEPAGRSLAAADPSLGPAESSSGAAPSHPQAAGQQGLAVALPGRQREANSEAAADAAQQPSADRHRAADAGLVHGHSAGSASAEVQTQLLLPSSGTPADIAQRSPASGHATSEQPLRTQSGADQQQAAESTRGGGSYPVSVEPFVEEVSRAVGSVDDVAASAASNTSPVRPWPASTVLADHEAALASGPATEPTQPGVPDDGATPKPEQLQSNEQENAPQSSFGASSVKTSSHSASTADVAPSQSALDSMQLAYDTPAEALAAESGDNGAAADIDSTVDGLPAAFPLHASASAAMAATTAGDASTELIAEGRLVEQQVTLAQAAAASYDAPSLLGSFDEARLRPSQQELRLRNLHIVADARWLEPRSAAACKGPAEQQSLTFTPPVSASALTTIHHEPGQVWQRCCALTSLPVASCPDSCSVAHRSRPEAWARSSMTRPRFRGGGSGTRARP